MHQDHFQHFSFDIFTRYLSTDCEWHNYVNSLYSVFSSDICFQSMHYLKAYRKKLGDLTISQTFCFKTALDIRYSIQSMSVPRQKSKGGILDQMIQIYILNQGTHIYFVIEHKQGAFRKGCHFQNALQTFGLIIIRIHRILNYNNQTLVLQNAMTILQYFLPMYKNDY